MPTVEELAATAHASGTAYVEFLRVPSMSAGVYVLPVGGVDSQSPHSEDEVYYVVRGRARFRDGERERTIGGGDTLFVTAHRSHRFFAIEEELLLLVVFAPPESDGPPSEPEAPESGEGRP